MINVKGEYYYNAYTTKGVGTAELTFADMDAFKAWVTENCIRDGERYVALYYNGDNPTDNVYRFELKLKESSRYNPFYGYCNLWVSIIEVDGKIVMSTGRTTDGIMYFRDKAMDIRNRLNEQCKMSDFNFG